MDKYLIDAKVIYQHYPFFAKCIKAELTSDF